MGTGQEGTSGSETDGQQNQVLSFRRKFVYATGTIGDSLPYNATSFYLFFYLTTVVGISPLDAGILVGLPAFFLFPLDPIAGVLSDRVRSRFGRRHIFLITCGPFACACFFLRFYAPPGWDTSILFIYWFAVQLAYSVGATLTMVSYTAMTAELSPSSSERAQIVSIQQGFGLVGTALGSALTIPIVNALRGGRLGFAEMAGIYAVVMVAVFLSASAVTSRRQAPSEQSAVWKDTVVILRFRAFWFQSGIWFLISTVSTVVNALLIFYLMYVLVIPEMLPRVMLLVIIGGMASLPLWNLLSSRLDKRRVIGLGAVVFAVVLTSLLFLSGSSLLLLWPLACFAGVGTVSLSFLRIAMMTDLIA